MNGFSLITYYIKEEDGSGFTDINLLSDWLDY